MQIELTRGYDYSSFRDDLRKFYWNTGVANRETVFLITDTQVVKEEFMEDIQNILNSGEVPNLFLGDDYERVILGVKDDCMKSKPKGGGGGGDGGDFTREVIFDFFLNRARQNLRICCCMSPIGEAFRRRCQMFPSLVSGPFLLAFAQYIWRANNFPCTKNSMPRLRIVSLETIHTRVRYVL